VNASMDRLESYYQEHSLSLNSGATSLSSCQFHLIGYQIIIPPDDEGAFSRPYTTHIRAHQYFANFRQVSISAFMIDVITNGFLVSYCHIFIETEYGVQCKSSFDDALSFPEMVPSPVLPLFCTFRNLKNIETIPLHS
jgi:hypothetical protein